MSRSNTSSEWGNAMFKTALAIVAMTSFTLVSLGCACCQKAQEAEKKSAAASSSETYTGSVAARVNLNTIQTKVPK